MSFSICLAHLRSHSRSRLRFRSPAAPRLRRPRALLAFTLVALLASPSSLRTRAQAPTIIVDRTVDAPDIAPGDGTCAMAGGGCTLRAAVQESNAHPGPDVIELPAGTYALTLIGEDDAGATGDLDATDALTVRGAGAAATVLDASAVERAVQAPTEASLEIDALHVVGSRSDDSSARWRGAIEVGGALTLDGVTVEGGTGIGVLLSTATPGRIERSSITGNRGGGIRTTAPLAITDSRIEDNGPASGVFAGTDAGGVFADADVYIARSHLGGNRPLALDGQLDRAHYTVRDSTLLDNGVRGILTAVNTTFDGGSALRLEAGSALTNVTLTGAADTQVLVAYRGAIRLANTAIAGRCLLESAVYSGGGNVVTSDSCAAALPDMAITADLALGPLADNGGPTWTRSPLAASPLRGAGAASACPTFDQRGFARPPASRCDSGAVEVGASAVGAPTPTPHDWANGPRPWSTLQPYATPESVAPRADFGLDVVAQAGGASRALALDGDRAWVSVGAWLVALDRRDAAHPVELGRLRLPELITAIAHDAGSGRLAVRTTDALAVVDGADPSRPTRIAWLPLPAMPGAPSWGERALEGGVAVADGSIAVVSGDDNRWDGDGRMAIWVATIGPGAAPRWRGFARPTISFGNVGGSSPPLAWPIVAGGARAWVGIGSSVAALDVADPDAPLVTGHLDLYARVTSLALAGDRLFAGLIRTAGRPYDDPLIELAVLDPGVGAPTQRTLAPLSMAAADALAADGAGVVALCASCRQPLFQAFARAAGDTLTPGEPIPVARHVRALAVAGDDVVLALGDGGIAARPRAADGAALGGLWDPPGPAADVVGDGDWAAWTTSLAPAEGFRAPDLEVVEPSVQPLGRVAAWTAPHQSRPRPPRVGRIDLDGPRSGHLVVAGAGLWAIDLTDRAAPGLRLLVDRNVEDAVVDGATAWIVEDGRAEALDVGTPGGARSLGLLRGAGGRIVGLELNADRLVARHADGPIATYDPAASTGPAPAGVFSRSSGGDDGQALLHGGALVVAQRSVEIEPWNGVGMAEDGASPIDLGVRCPCDARGVTPDGRFVWIADGWHGVSVIDVADPRRPFLAAHAPIPGEALRIAVAGDRVLVAAGDGGVVVLRRSALAARAWLPWAGRGR